MNLDLHSSSRVKGETVLDTIYTLQAMAVDVFVMRDSEPGLPAIVASHVQPHVSVLNAGEAHVSHPTQGLLDALTIRQRKGDVGNLCVAIVGDIRHSRVARSSGTALQTLGVGELRFVSPASLDARVGRVPRREALHVARGRHPRRGRDHGAAHPEERMDQTQIPDVDAFVNASGASPSAASWLAKPDAVVLHPGPMNRGVEITSEVADGPQSADPAAGAQRRRRAHGGARHHRAQRADAQRRGRTEGGMSEVDRAHRGTIFVEDAELLSQQAFPGQQFVIRLQAPKCAAAATPGSFAHLTCDPERPMRRPLSIMRVDARAGWIDMLYKIVGPGLEALSKQPVGAPISVIGPIGQGFTAHRRSGRARCWSAAASASRRWCSSPSR